MQLDIKDFTHLLRKHSLLREAMQFTKEHVLISRKDLQVIFHTRKSVLYNDGEPWMKKEGSSFDVNMGVYDEVFICYV